VEILGLAGAPIGRRAVRGGRERRPRPRDHRIPQRRLRDKAAGVTAGARGTLDEMLARIQAGVQKEVAS
jgi:translation initiation factor IF-2